MYKREAQMCFVIGDERYKAFSEICTRNRLNMSQVMRDYVDRFIVEMREKA